MFTKLGRAITIAARDGGGDSETNSALRLVIDKARQINMPTNNIDAAIKRGTGESDDGITIEKAVYGGYGPGGVAIVVDVTTDNKNRTVAELRKIFEDGGGNLSEASSVLWQFREKGRVIVKSARILKGQKYGEKDEEVKVDRDELIIELMDVDGVEDIKEVGNGEDGFEYCEVITGTKDLMKVRNAIEQEGYILEDAELIKLAENLQRVDESTKEKVNDLLESLSEHDDVDKVWDNMG